MGVPRSMDINSLKIFVVTSTITSNTFLRYDLCLKQIPSFWRSKMDLD